MATIRVKFRYHGLVALCIVNMMLLSSAKPTADTAEGNNEIDDAYIKEREEYANKMMTYMNRSVDPCDDFYEYACGNWANVIEEHNSNQKREGVLEIGFYLNKLVEGLMETPPEELPIDGYEHEWALYRKFYESCLRADVMPMKRSDEYLNAIRAIGGFPAVDSATWNATQFDWFNMSAHLSNYGIRAFAIEEILPQHPFFPYFRLPEFGFDVSVHYDTIASNTSSAYTRNRDRIVDYLTLYEVDPVIIPRVVEEIFEFWHAILNMTKPFGSDIQACGILDTVDGEEVVFEDFQKYFDIAWRNKDFPRELCNHFFVEVDKICRAHKEAAANYMALLFLFEMDARLNDAKFQKEYCVSKIWTSMPYLIDNVYLKKYFNTEVREEILSIVSEIRVSLLDMLQNESDWLDDATRTEALRKESTIQIRIGNHEDDALKERLIREMNNLTFVEDNFEANNMELKKFKTFMKRYLGLHNEEMSNVTTKPLELLMAMQVNAFYYNLDNSINVMAGILYPPAYHKAWPNALKFGTIGYLIGHEFTHGFDTVGGMFDHAGEERSWWSKKSAKVFADRANCYVKHFNSYLVPQINRTINGELTKDENIADGGGLREALTAYRRFMKEQAKELGPKLSMRSEQMPGLDLSPEQLFFLGFSQLWCSSLKEEHYWELLTDEHTIDKYRVLGSLTNYEEFAKVYNCPAGSKMHPKEEQCRLW